MSTILFLLCQLQAECADRKGGVTAGQLRQLSTLYSVGESDQATGGGDSVSVSATKTSPATGSATSSVDFRSIMKNKSNQVHYSTPSTPTATEKVLEESFPDQIFASGLDLENDYNSNVTFSGKLQQSKNDTRDEGIDLGIETTINPFQDEVYTDKPETDEQPKQIQTEVEDDRSDVVNINQVDNNQVLSSSKSSSSSKSRVKAAVITKHSFEFRPIKIEPVDHEAIHEPKIIEVEAKSMPLEIHFKSASSRIKLVQSHKSLGELNENEIQRTTSNEEVNLDYLKYHFLTISPLSIASASLPPNFQAYHKRSP